MAVVISSKWLVRPGEEKAVAAAAAALVEATRQEPGCLLIQPHRDPGDARVFYFYEQWADQAALDAHCETEHFRRFVLEEGLPRLEVRGARHVRNLGPLGGGLRAGPD